MAAVPLDRPSGPLTASPRVVPFDAGHAAAVANWVTDPDELFLVAPGTAPPSTPAKVLAWARPGDCPYVLLADAGHPVGYAELNRFENDDSHLWIGHFVIDPQRRRRGYGAALLRFLLACAFEARRARQVSLTVFPDNRPAVACYERAGFAHVQTELRHFASTGRWHPLAWMRLTQRRYFSRQGGRRGLLARLLRPAQKDKRLPCLPAQSPVAKS